MPSSAVLIAPANVTIILPPWARWASYPLAASTNAAALKCRKCFCINCEIGPLFIIVFAAINAISHYNLQGGNIFSFSKQVKNKYRLKVYKFLDYKF